MPSAERTTVYLCDRHPVFREGLARVLAERPELHVVGEAGGDDDDALTEIVRLRPTVVVVDLHLPEARGETFVATVAHDAPETKVLVLSGSLDPRQVYLALSAGANGYLSKERSGATICDAILAVAQGEVQLDPSVQGGLVGEIRHRGEAVPSSLTDREREILCHVADGLTTPQIASHLFLSPATVKSHLSTVYDKLDVPDRSAAVAVAMRRGLLD